jgi:hypothetical protein
MQKVREDEEAKRGCYGLRVPGETEDRSSHVGRCRRNRACVIG